MEESIIYKDEYIKIFACSDDIYIETYKRGLPVDRLNLILSSHPEIGVTSFKTLKSSINFASKRPEKFGELKEEIVVEILNNGLSAFITYNLPKERLHLDNRGNLIIDTMSKLDEKDITFGIKRELFSGELITGKSYTIAEGIPPIHGKDAVIKMYEFEEPKPVVCDDGKVDFYELKLINRVEKGDWLGERIEATEGIPGISVKNEPIKSVSGRNYPLNYDKNSVYEVLEDEKTVLYSRMNGAVSYKNGKISVSNCLEIDGDVGVSTGNIKFDGYVTVKGTICDGFFVEATSDIEINGELGLGNIKGITSTGGSIYIKGGITSKNRAEVKAAKNIFTRFVDNVIIECGGTVHIGYYCFNSIINSMEVVLDSSNGKITGGRIKAQIRVIASIIGSEIETRTHIEVAGFNRKSLIEDFDKILYKINELKNEQQKLKLKLSYLDEQESLNPFQRREYSNVTDRLFNIRDEIKKYESERKSISGYLKARGDGEIAITRKVYPNCILLLSNNLIEINTESHAVTYYIQNSEIKQV